MAICRAEKISRGEWCRHYKKYLKKITNKWRRRTEKRLLGDAPRKNEYCGWSL